jgi:hypothetical protein
MLTPARWKVLLCFIAFAILAAASFLVIPHPRTLWADDAQVKTVVFSIPDFRNGTIEEIDKATDKLISSHRRLVEELVGEIQRPGLSDPAKVRIVHVLGELRDPRALDVLIENMNLKSATVTYEEDRLPRWSSWPAREALVKMGSFAVARIIEVIGSNKFDEKCVEAYAQVIKCVEGLHYGEIRLQSGMALGGTDKMRKQFEMVIDRLKHPQPAK